MQRVVVSLVLLAGCSFRTNAHTGGSDGPVAIDDAPPGDGPLVVDARPIDAPPDARPDSPPPPPAFCDRNDPTLVACYEFENTTNDGSPNGLNATSTNVTYVAGKRGQAAHAVAMTAMNVAQNAALDVPALTVECWIKAPLPPMGSRAGIVDNNGDWGFFLQPGGALQGIGLTSTANVPANTWTHVAITYDGTTRHYVNGVEVGSLANTTISTTAGTTGISIAADNPPGSGSPLNGDIDQLRIFSVARTPQQIAADAVP